MEALIRLSGQQIIHMQRIIVILRLTSFCGRELPL